MREEQRNNTDWGIILLAIVTIIVVGLLLLTLAKNKNTIINPYIQSLPNVGA